MARVKEVQNRLRQYDEGMPIYFTREDIADALSEIDRLEQLVNENHDWLCGCGHWNGANLPFCAVCNRRPLEDGK